MLKNGGWEIRGTVGEDERGEEDERNADDVNEDIDLVDVILTCGWVDERESE